MASARSCLGDYGTQALVLLYFTLWLTCVGITCISYAVLFHDFAHEEMPISGRHYLEVVFLENDSRGSQYYFGCLARKYNTEWTALSNFVGMF
jgi:hypothetical protein